MNDQQNAAPASATGLSMEDFLLLGLDAVAAIRPIRTKSGTIYGIFAANGEQIGAAPTRDIARASAIQNDLQPVDMH
jgi:hypothetical protein